MTEVPHLPLQIASGIVLAFIAIWLFRSAVELIKRKDYGLGGPAFILASLIGGGLVLTGLGLAPY